MSAPVDTLLKAGRRSGRWTLRLSTILLLMTALSLCVSRYLFAYLVDHPTALQTTLSTHLDAPVAFEAVSVDWRGWKPRLEFTDFRLGTSQSKTLPALRFERGLLELDIVGSLLRRRLELGKLRIDGLRLTVAQDAGVEWPFDFDPRSADSPPVNAKLAARLLNIPVLDLVFRELKLNSADDSKTPLVFQDLRLTLGNTGEKRRLQVHANLPEELGQSLQAVLEWRGDLFDSAKARFYLRGETLALAHWPLPLKLAGGRADDLEVWGTWQKGAVQALEGHITLDDLALPELAPVAGLDQLLQQIPSIVTEFSWRRGSRGWLSRANLIGRDAKGGARLKTALGMRWESATMDRTAQLRGYCRNLAVDDIATVIAPWLRNRPQRALAALKPTGQVTKLVFRAQFDSNGRWLPPRYTVAAQLQGVAIDSWQGMPAIEGIAGRVIADEEGGRLQLQGQEIALTGGDLPAPMVLQLTGPLRWRYLTDGLQLASVGLDLSNADVSARLQGRVSLSKAAASPYLDLRLRYGNMQLRQIRRYLRAFPLHPKLLAWLDRALVRGRVSKGALRLRGYAHAFPYDQGQGVFEARFYVADAVLDYAPRWPWVEALRAEVFFRNRALRVTAVAGKIHGVNINHLDAQIPDLQRALLTIQAQARGPGKEFVRFLRNAPLPKPVASYGKAMEATGVNTLDLSMKIPLTNPRGVQVHGAVGFARGDLLLPGWDLQLSDLEGVVEFTRDELNAQGLDLRWHDQPVRLDIATQRGSDGGRETRFRLQGRVGVAALGGRHASVLQNYVDVDGKADWEARVVVPASGPIRLELASNMQGMSVKLPAPLAKAASEIRRFKAHVNFDRERARLRGWFEYGAAVKGALEWLDFPAATQSAREQSSVVNGPAQPAQPAGLKITAHLPYFTLASAQAGGGNPMGRWPTWLRMAEVRVGKLVLGNQQFPCVDLALTPGDDGAAITIFGETVGGRIYIPAKVTPQTPIAVKLQHLTLVQDSPSPSSTGKPLGPETIPPFWMTVQELMLDGNTLGQLRLAVVPHERGVRLNQFDLRSEVHRISATGDWLHPRDEYPLSRLRIELTSNNLSKTLQAFDYEGRLQGGKAKVNLAVSWKGPLSQPTADALDGHLQLHLTKGSLLALEPGLGRLMGLLNIGSLARRVQLDFSDLFEQGLGFDLIEGHVEFRKGHAYTSVAIEAPSAQMHIAGRIGIQAQDYDQTVTIVPQVSSPLAIAGTIAAGPAVGAAVFLAERLFKPEINQVARYRYTITGSWDDPVVQRVKLPNASWISPKGYD